MYGIMKACSVAPLAVQTTQSKQDSPPTCLVFNNQRHGAKLWGRSVARCFVQRVVSRAVLQCKKVQPTGQNSRLIVCLDLEGAACW